MPAPWTASYPPTCAGTARSLRPVDQILDDAVARWPDQVAIDFMGRRFSYAELASWRRAARGLQALGVGLACTWACTWPTRRTT